MGRLYPKLTEDSFRETKTDRIHTLKGSYPDFELKDYCPAVFRNILELQDIDYTEYLQSICGDEHLLHFVASGKFGNVFVSSINERFVMKIIRKSELKVMLDMLPSYYQHLQTYRASLLSKLLGLHSIRLFGGVKAHISVMCNELKSTYQVHRCYDLKGTEIGRNTSYMVAENCPVFKDIDFDFCFYLDPVVHLRLLRQIKYDCEYLEAEGTMNYSLLLGLHVKGQHEGLLNCKSFTNRGTNSCRSSSSEWSSSIKGNLDEYSKGNYDTESSLSYLSTTSESNFCKLGKEVPGRAMRTQKNSFEVVLNFGIVDIFQSYDVSKRIEHLYRSIQYDRHSITAVNPKKYSSRFQDFLGKVFKAEDSINAYPGFHSISSDSEDTTQSESL